MLLMMSPRSPSSRSTRLGLWRYNPFASLDLSRQPHALQLARPLDQQRAVLTERVAHVLVGTQVGELPPLLLGDQHPVEPGEAIGIHFPLKLLRYLQLGLPAELQRNDLAGAFANAVGDIVAGDVRVLPSSVTPRTRIWVCGCPVLW